MNLRGYWYLKCLPVTTVSHLVHLFGGVDVKRYPAGVNTNNTGCSWQITETQMLPKHNMGDFLFLINQKKL